MRVLNWNLTVFFFLSDFEFLIENLLKAKEETTKI